MTHIISSILMLLWYTFYAQFVLITWCLEYLLLDQDRTYWSFIWHFNGDSYDLSWIVFIFTGLIWDTYLIIILRYGHFKRNCTPINDILDESEI